MLYDKDRQKEERKVKPEELAGWRKPCPQEAEVIGQWSAKSAKTGKVANISWAIAMAIVIIPVFSGVATSETVPARVLCLAGGICFTAGCIGCIRMARTENRRKEAAGQGKFMVLPCRLAEVECGDGTLCGAHVLDSEGNGCPNGFPASGEVYKVWKEDRDAMFLLARLEPEGAPAQYEVFAMPEQRQKR